MPLLHQSSCSRQREARILGIRSVGNEPFGEQKCLQGTTLAIAEVYPLYWEVRRPEAPGLWLSIRQTWPSMGALRSFGGTGKCSGLAAIRGERGVGLA